MMSASKQVNSASGSSGTDGGQQEQGDDGEQDRYSGAGSRRNRGRGVEDSLTIFIHLRNEIKQLKKQLKEKEDKIKELDEKLQEVGISTTTTKTEPSSSTTMEILPPEILCKLFKYLDPPSLCESRVICHKWLNAIHGSTSLMRKLQFNVFNIQQFMTSNLATNVRSLRFPVHLINSTAEELTEFFQTIGPTLEEVTFSFPDTNGDAKLIDNQSVLFTLMLKYCLKVDKFTVACKDVKFLRALTSIEVQTFGGNLKVLLLDVEHIKHGDIPLVKAFLYSLPAVEKIGYFDEYKAYEYWTSIPQQQMMPRMVDPRMVELVGVLCEYMEIQQGSLKEIDLTNILKNKTFWQGDLKLVLTTGKFNIQLKFSYDINLNTIIHGEEIPDLPFNEINCRTITKGRLVLTGFDIFDNDLHYGRTLYFTNLQCLCLQLYIRWDSIPVSRLQFFSCLRNLKVLAIEDLAGRHEDELNFFQAGLDEAEADAAIAAAAGEEVEEEEEPEQMWIPFNDKLSSLGMLTVNGDLPWTQMPSFDHAFPNLTVFDITCAKNLPEDFICKLVKLDKLEMLNINTTNSLTDALLICPYAMQQQVNNDDKEQGKIIVPAIAAIRGLKQLNIVHCDSTRLTDRFLAEGIIYCKTLEKLMLRFKNEQFTKIGFNYVQENTRLRIVEEEEFGNYCPQQQRIAKVVYFSIY